MHLFYFRNSQLWNTSDSHQYLITLKEWEILKKLMKHAVVDSLLLYLSVEFINL